MLFPKTRSTLDLGKIGKNPPYEPHMPVMIGRRAYQVVAYTKSICQLRERLGEQDSPVVKKTKLEDQLELVPENYTLATTSEIIRVFYMINQNIFGDARGVYQEMFDYDQATHAIRGNNLIITQLRNQGYERISQRLRRRVDQRKENQKLTDKTALFLSEIKIKEGLIDGKCSIFELPDLPKEGYWHESAESVLPIGQNVKRRQVLGFFSMIYGFPRKYLLDKTRPDRLDWRRTGKGLTFDQVDWTLAENQEDPVHQITVIATVGEQASIDINISCRRDTDAIGLIMEVVRKIRVPLDFYSPKAAQSPV